ncbi:Ig-like domain-containing protein [Paraglaciecola aquimarina]|uniref:Ig-like domain-containing protein n=1 Tax=Paraglaciecola aquimarina TaxID=1235557 RepID=A0ABU3SXH2_9ALTE|nr:Ig-like domain-containing protein [Paraglaciecola aquimarina]MDU0354677.1 Ig-like domain-containing protein [Paraglaciecola aquimarina]
MNKANRKYRCYKTLVAVICVLNLVACGGGGSLEREGGDTEDQSNNDHNVVTRTVDMAFTELKSGQASKELTSTSALRLTTAVFDSNGNPVIDTLVTFTVRPEGVAVFANDTGTAHTNSQGVATLDIFVGQLSGAGEMTASLDSGETANLTFVSAGSAQINQQPASLALFASATQLASSGSDQIELLALVKNANNVLLEGIEVIFSADAAANLALVDGGSVSVTGKDGIARAFLSTLNNPENRRINVSASAKGLQQTETLEVQVVGSEININGAASLSLHDSTPITVHVVDSDGKGIAGQTVTMFAQNGLLSHVIGTTSGSGQFSVDYTARRAGNDTIRATSLNATGSFQLVVQQDSFTFNSEPNSVIALADSAILSIKWLKDNMANVGGKVTLTTSRGTVLQSESVTDENGLASFTVQSDNAGLAAMSATGWDSDTELVTATTQVEFVAIEAASIMVDATPDSIAPSGQTSRVTAVVRDPNGNLVKGKGVNFVVHDVSGGFISPSEGITDRSGIAAVVFTSNAVSSYEAVTVQATVIDTPQVMGVATLTVGDRAFDISIGTGRLLEVAGQSSYAKEFTVFVTDPDSNPVANAAMSFSAPPVKFIDGGIYKKGSWLWDELDEIWYQNIAVSCANEDINGNGILDEGEDTNQDGLLTPGNVVSIPPNTVTDSNGQTLVNILYAKQFGGWAEVEVTVKAQSAGSESAESQSFLLPIAVADLTVEGSSPPNSPYGVGPNCTDTH